nr:unnamed protein product [Spirometra erinaceieuropaei]
MMVSFDVVSLFTSIPLDLAKQCTEDLLKSCDTDVPAIALLELLDLCMETNFSFDQQYYQQLKGAPMGSPISGFLAEITMQKLKATALPTRIVGACPFEKGREFLEAMHSDESCINRHIELDAAYKSLKEKWKRREPIGTE